ncbi:hypothetical protein [Nocardia sp. CC227C]|uniref:hypothetical protein n=1 Tax=Nocardia sp. CC227C TaxID=3044562 RepID=UPI00278BDE43|nr:hypothetical protein [Nocardia sp. CC227C]
MTKHRRAARRGRRREYRFAVRSGAELRQRPVRVPTTRCAVGKRRYFLRMDAELVLAGIDHTDPARRERRSYRCQVCDGWHLTSWTVEQFSARRMVAQGATIRRRTATASARPRALLDLSSITVDPTGVPTPAEVARRTAPSARAAVSAPTAPGTPCPSSSHTSARARFRVMVRHLVRRIRRI